MNEAKLERLKWPIRAAAIAAGLAIWQAAGSATDPHVYSTPLNIAESLVSITLSGALPAAYVTTLVDFATGFIISIALGISIGAAMARFRTVEYALDPVINAAYATPYIALVPLFVLWLGIGFTARVAIVILSSIFYIIVNSHTGFKTINKNLVETGRSFGLSGRSLYAKVILPAAFPFIIAGLRLGIAKAVIGAIVGEFFILLVGIGFLIEFYAESLLIAPVFAVAFVISLTGLALTESLKYVEGRVSTWRVGATGG
jgi:NitT/TauT family transport system permease protein